LSVQQNKLIVLNRDQVDLNKWDRAVNNSANGSIYALSWFLDAVSDSRWEAWVSDEAYTFVMPVIPNRKYLIPYFYKPLLCQQLGVFGQEKVTTDIQQLFFTKLASRFASIDITIHGGMNISPQCSPLPNHIVTLSAGIDEVRKGYNRNTQRNIQKSKATGHQITMTDDHSEVLAFLLSNQPFTINDREKQIIIKLMAASHQAAVLDVFWLRQEKTNHSVGVCMRFGRRAYFLLTAGTSHARIEGLSFALIDHMIEYYAAAFELFDFTGSSNENIAQRNLGFGASVETYYRYRKRWM
jgi:hypothetical protein